MSRIERLFDIPSELVLGTRINERVPEADQRRQRREVEEIMRRLRRQPGVILADEVGMGKTFVALGCAYSVAVRKKSGPVVVMVPANLIDKWVQDLNAFCSLYLEDREPVQRGEATLKELRRPTAVRYGVARHSVDLMKLLDDSPRERCHLIFLAQGAMSRSQSDKWVRLSLIAEALRRHARGNANKLIQVKKHIPRFLGELLWAIGEERAHGWGDELWRKLLQTGPEAWKDIYNATLRDERRQLQDDPVPKSVSRAISRIDLKPIAEALAEMPLRTSERLSERISDARRTLLKVEKTLWNAVLAKTRWRSPLLVLDEAHHLKNPGTALARQLQSPDSKRDLRTGDGAMANAFDRMLFLTATPFQLGHHELVSVLERFGGIRWEPLELGSRETFQLSLDNLGERLTESQRSAIALQRRWSRLRPEDCDVDNDVDLWWKSVLDSPRESLTNHQSAVVDAYEAAKSSRQSAEKALGPWIVRHNKTPCWPNTAISRRERLDGAAIDVLEKTGGLTIPSGQLLPFFLAARSAARPSKDVLGEALCSSYEAFRFTRKSKEAGLDEQEETASRLADLSHSRWYLTEFDSALESTSGAGHPKISATVRRVVDLWEEGEKVLVFAFYRHSCRALRIHISDEIGRRIAVRARNALRNAGQDINDDDVERLLERIRKRFFDDVDSPGRKALDRALRNIVQRHSGSLDRAEMSDEQRESLITAMRRFLRVSTTLIRCFPLAEVERLKPAEAVARTLDHVDGSAGSWRERFDNFINFLTQQCSESEREPYLEAALKTETGTIGVSDDEDGNTDVHRDKLTLANVQVATGTTKRETRARLMRAFNTPFFPDIFVCSEVMGEGVDLQRFCRHVIHHDLAWNPSNIEQRTGRIDRLGCKAEGKQSIVVYLPYLAGTADERQYRVMSDRERWFRVVMGQDAVARLITPEASCVVQLPSAVSEELSFDLSIGDA
jgi:superfamily II DNA or RNA helicase